MFVQNDIYIYIYIYIYIFFFFFFFFFWVLRDSQRLTCFDTVFWRPYLTFSVGMALNQAYLRSIDVKFTPVIGFGLKFIWIQQMKSGSRTIYVLLIVSFSVYRCHGNIDFSEN